MSVQISPEVRHRINEILDRNPNREPFWREAWITGNGDVSVYVERDLAIARAERKDWVRD